MFFHILPVGLHWIFKTNAQENQLLYRWEKLGFKSLQDLSHITLLWREGLTSSPHAFQSQAAPPTWPTVQPEKWCLVEDALCGEWAPCSHHTRVKCSLGRDFVGRSPVPSGSWMSSLPPLGAVRGWTARMDFLSPWPQLGNCHNHAPTSFQYFIQPLSMPDSLQPHELQHAKLPCPPLSPGVCSNSYPLNQWSCLTISRSATPFSSCSQSSPMSKSFSVNHFFISGGQRIGVSSSASVLSMNILDWFSLGWTGWIFLQFKGLSRVFSNTTIQKHQFFSTQLSLRSNSHVHTYYWKNHSFD